MRNKVVPRKRSASFGMRALFSRQGGSMNFSPRMLPGLTLLLCGAALALASGRICSGEGAKNRLKLIGVLIAAAGAALVFLA